MHGAPHSATKRTRSIHARRLTGGTRNEVVERHPNACQHCGFYGIPADVTCSQCGIRAHAQCLDFLDGKCGMCHAGEDEHVATCALCLRDDPRDGVEDATDRLTKQVAYYGRSWSLSENDEAQLREQGYDVLEEGSVCIDQGAVRRRNLPRGGIRRMAIWHDGSYHTSDPVVVHTWCALALFQVSPREAKWADHIALRLETPLRLRNVGYSGRGKGDGSVPATCDTLECLFCGQKEGWTTYCLYHQMIPSGCPTCRSAPAGVGKRCTSLFFHPSCAVRHGMQRFGRGTRFGMICQAPRQWRARRLVHCKMWMGFPSGINEFLRGYADVTEEAMRVPDVPCKGVSAASSKE